MSERGMVTSAAIVGGAVLSSTVVVGLVMAIGWWAVPLFAALAFLMLRIVSHA